MPSPQAAPDSVAKTESKGKKAIIVLRSIFPEFRARISNSEFDHQQIAGNRVRKVKSKPGIVVRFKDGRAEVAPEVLEAMKERVAGYKHKWIEEPVLYKLSRGDRDSRKMFSNWTRQAYIRFTLARKLNSNTTETEFSQAYLSSIQDSAQEAEKEKP